MRLDDLLEAERSGDDRVQRAVREPVENECLCPRKACRIADDLNTGALVGLFAGQSEFRYDSHAQWPRSPRLPPKVRVAVDTLAAGLQKLMA